eukprot:2871130-Amphidinium_carterae.1
MVSSTSEGNYVCGRVEILDGIPGLYLPHGCPEHVYLDFDVLVQAAGSTILWVPGKAGEMAPEGAVWGGEDKEGTFYVGRTQGSHEECILPGTVHPKQ